MHGMGSKKLRKVFRNMEETVHVNCPPKAEEFAQPQGQEPHTAWQKSCCSLCSSTFSLVRCNSPRDADKTGVRYDGREGNSNSVNLLKPPVLPVTPPGVPGFINLLRRG